MSIFGRVGHMLSVQQCLLSLVSLTFGGPVVAEAEFSNNAVLLSRESNLHMCNNQSKNNNWIVLSTISVMW